MRHTFPKNEKLTSKKVFEQLFSSGKSMAAYPYRFVWVRNNILQKSQAKIGISVPKRLFSKAVDRNKLKRRIRESYRKNKKLLYLTLEAYKISVSLLVIYTAKEELSYSDLDKKMILSLPKLAEKIQEG